MIGRIVCAYPVAQIVPQLLQYGKQCCGDVSCALILVEGVSNVSYKNLTCSSVRLLTLFC